VRATCWLLFQLSTCSRFHWSAQKEVLRQQVLTLFDELVAHTESFVQQHDGEEGAAQRRAAVERNAAALPAASEEGKVAVFLSLGGEGDLPPKPLHPYQPLPAKVGTGIIRVALPDGSILTSEDYRKMVCAAASNPYIGWVGPEGEANYLAFQQAGLYADRGPLGKFVQLVLAVTAQAGLVTSNVYVLWRSADKPSAEVLKEAQHQADLLGIPLVQQRGVLPAHFDTHGTGVRGLLPVSDNNVGAGASVTPAPNSDSVLLFGAQDGKVPHGVLLSASPSSHGTCYLAPPAWECTTPLASG